MFTMYIVKLSVLMLNIHKSFFSATLSLKQNTPKVDFLSKFKKNLSNSILWGFRFSFLWKLSKASGTLQSGGIRISVCYDSELMRFYKFDAILWGRGIFAGEDWVWIGCGRFSTVWSLSPFSSVLRSHSNIQGKLQIKALRKQVVL